jgi:hypothetical protein
MWKDIDGFEGRYGISDLGEVQNVNTKKILTPTSDKDGYLHIGLRKLGDRKKFWFRIHRLVAIAFCEKPDNWTELEVDHIDRNKKNNVPENLRWVTSQINNNNRKDTCWKTNTTTGELYITKYRNGFMVRINRNELKHQSWHHTIEDAVIARSNAVRV